MEIVDIPSKEQRHKRIEEVRRMSKLLRHPEFRNPDMDELFHSDFWIILGDSIDRIGRREDSTEPKRPNNKSDDFDDDELPF